MNSALLRTLAAAACACVAGCASRSLSGRSFEDDTGRFKRVTVDQARDAVAIGITRSDLLDALGQTAAVRFESGYEVWVYRLMPDGRTGQGDRPSAAGRASPRSGEFVVLIAPSGRVTRTRMWVPPPRE